MKPSSYRPDIDGLRAIAVLAVVFFHAGLGCPGGFVGVDVFFVISGYLIGGILRRDLEADVFSFGEFWERRVRRIMPAALVMSAVTLAYGTSELLPAELVELARSTLFQQAMASNAFFAWSMPDYFGGPAEYKPLLHTWSLAVEEQFYLALPLVMYGLRRVRRGWLAAGLGCAACASFAICVVLGPERSFFNPVSRSWELLVGVIASLAPTTHRWIRPWGTVLTLGGLLGMGYAVSCWSASTPFPGWATLLPCFATAAVLLGGKSSELVALRGLSARPLVFVGKISYSLYLWHWPVLVAFRQIWGEGLSTSARLIAVAVSIALGWLSWRYVENRWRQPNPDTARRRVFWTAAGASVAVSIAAFLVVWTDGLPGRIPPNVRALAEGNELRRDWVSQDTRTWTEEGPPGLGVPSGRDDPPDFLVWGDSHALPVAEALNDLASEAGLSGVIAARFATVPLLVDRAQPNAKELWNQSVVEYVRAKRVPCVLLVARWDVKVEGRPDGRLDTLLLDRHSHNATRAEAQFAFERSLRRTIAALQQAGASVWVMQQVPTQSTDPIRALVRAARRGMGSPPSGIPLSEHVARQRRVSEAMERSCGDNVRFIDPTPYCFDTAGNSILGGGGRAYYCDEDHLSPLGARRLLAAPLAPFLDAVARIRREATEARIPPVAAN